MQRDALAPVVAAGLACSYLASAVLAPGLLFAVLPLAVVACGALVLLRRPRRSLTFVLAGIFAWLVLGLVGASGFSASPRGGLAWVLVVLFFLPLPVVPWLYWRTFHIAPDDPDHPSGAGRAGGPIPDSRFPSPGEGGGT